MAFDTFLSRRSGLLAVIAATGVGLAPIPALAHAEDLATAQVPAAQDGVRVGAGPGVPRLPGGLSALSWAVTDLRTGHVLAARNVHRRLAPASTLKALFAVTVLPKFSQHTVRRVSARDLAGIGAGSSMVGIQAGKRYKVADLWRGVFLRSGNDAVRVLANMNGGWAATAREMQAKARQLGARDTWVKSPDGYDAWGQVSSAYDLSLIARAGLANADFARHCATVRARFPSSGGPSFEIQNTNRLLVGTRGLPRYRGLIGVKNGYTSHAGNTLIVAAKRGGRTVLVTVMNPQSGRSNAVYKEARSLLDWGFAAAGKARPVASLRAAATANEAWHDGRGAAPALATGPDAGQGGAPAVAAGAPATGADSFDPGTFGAAALDPGAPESLPPPQERSLAAPESLALPPERSHAALWAGGAGAVALTAGATVAWRLHARGKAAGRGDPAPSRDS